MMRRNPKPAMPAIALVLALVLWAAPAAAEDPRGPDSFAVTGARIFTGAGEVIEGGVVLIDDGLIVAVGRDVAVPPGAWVVDATGKSVYPGFIDALGSLGIPEPARENGEERARRPIARGPEDRPATTTWRAAADELKLPDERLEKWRSAGFTSAVTVPEDGILPGQAAFINLAGERERDMVVRTPLALRVNLSPPGPGRSFPGSLMGVVAYVKQVFFDAEHYRAAWAAYEAAPRGRQRPSYDRALAPLARARSEGWLVLLPGHWAHEIERAISLAKEIGVRPVLYGLHQGYAAADILGAERTPALVSLDWPERDEDADPEAEEPLRVLQMRERAPSTPAALERAGVHFAFYTDGLSKPGDALKSVKKAIDAGLSRERAVRAMSLDAASIFGLDDRLGSLEPGKIANLFIATGDVFEEGTRVETVFIDGRKLEIPESSGEEEKKDRGGSA